MSDYIKPIETTYKGRKFRSRLEARWAVFFDWLNVRWEYEHQGYVVNGTPYLPDFRLPDHGLLVEVKGPDPAAEYVEMLCNVATTLSPVALCVGLPEENLVGLFCHTRTGSEIHTYKNPKVMWHVGDVGGQLSGCIIAKAPSESSEFVDHEGRVVPGVVPGHRRLMGDLALGIVILGHEAATSARFEYRQSPNLWPRF